MTTNGPISTDFSEQFPPPIFADKNKIVSPFFIFSFATLTSLDIADWKDVLQFFSCIKQTSLRFKKNLKLWSFIIFGKHLAAVGRCPSETVSDSSQVQILFSQRHKMAF